MPYIICNNDNYLGQDENGFFIVHSQNEAFHWKEISKANSVHKNYCLKNKKVGRYHMEVKYVSQENKVVNPVAKPIELEYDILDKIREIEVFSKEIESRRLYLMEMMHNVELEIVDIEHAAEFQTLNVCKGYKIYKKLHEARIKRRIYKDEIQKINLSLGCSMNSSSIEKLQKCITGIDNKKYAPRIDKELFEL